MGYSIVKLAEMLFFHSKILFKKNISLTCHLKAHSDQRDLKWDDCEKCPKLAWRNIKLFITTKNHFNVSEY